MLTQASFEALRLHFDVSEFDGTESIYASRSNENGIAFVAIATDGKITTYKNDLYSEDLLEQEIIMLCCTKYDDNVIHIPREEKAINSREGADLSFSIFIELIVALILLVLNAIFLFIFWLLFRDMTKLLVCGGTICLPVFFFIFTIINSRMKRSGK